ncbi:MAG: MamI family restriction endonuclease [Methylococcales symbiont of Iophon sp. n. MRB-2018]|nr:MAG: MamI family restriction endonuclease [Methylococcales symbiont of Iophon sp. n. MRB-2018]
MQPDKRLIKIGDNESRIKLLLKELVLLPRVKALDWSKITKQTPNMKIGYPGQHLASLVTGMEGVRTGARGDDLEDGTEIKSCSRVDQLDNCKDCKKKLLRIEPKCPHCGSENINRMNDSKWLFSVKSEEELELLTNTIDRILLTISDYPNYDENDFETIRFQVFEIWNNNDRHKNFSIIMENYFYKIFLEHIKRNPRKTPAPKNFWPYSYQFYLCNPVKVFDAVVKNANKEPDIEIKLLVAPDTDRGTLEVEKMPTSLLSVDELRLLTAPENQYAIEAQLQNGKTFDDFVSISAKKSVNKKLLKETLPYINQQTRDLLLLRDTDKIAEEKMKYKRR